MTDALFQPIQLGSLSLKNRIVMPPMTRSRASQPGKAHLSTPTPLLLRCLINSMWFTFTLQKWIGTTRQTLRMTLKPQFVRRIKAH